MAHDDKRQSEKTLTITESELSKMIADAVAASMKDNMQVGMMAAAQLVVNANKQPVRIEDKYGALQECHLCGQKLRGCREQHVKMLVAPRNRHLLKDWPGIFLNGKWYKSTDGRTPITVPKENDFQYRINQWENSMEEFKASRTVEHNSGSIGGPNAQMNPYTGIGFNQAGDIPNRG